MFDQTVILPTARSVRFKQLYTDKETLFLPNYITMSDFLAKLCIVDGFKNLDEDSRVLLLLRASDFESFRHLQIERNFFTFTKNSSYIFSFFEELSVELYDIKKLNKFDVYAEYEEHVKILQKLYDNYEKLCLDNRVLDKIFLPKLYKFNSSYAKRAKNIKLYLDGYLTNFELELFLQCAKVSSVTIFFNATRFNLKMQNKFQKLGIELQDGYSYEISLNDLHVLSSKKIDSMQSVTCESFSEPILQVAFVQKKIYEFIKKGYAPQNIAIILPDEKFAQNLKNFDKKSNFNFAMGSPFSKTKIYEKLDAICRAIEQNSYENSARLKRVGDDFYEKISQSYHQKISNFDLVEILTLYKNTFLDKAECKIFGDELFAFEKIMPYMGEMSVKSALSLFLQRLSTKSIDDVMGGKITIMGVLESRHVWFDAVIIVDFNDSNVPKKSNKEMFLNSTIRDIAGLPTANDRENLQRYYYEMVMRRSKEVAISFVKSKDSNGSKFLKQLAIKEQNLYSENVYASLLFDKNSLEKQNEQEIVLEYSFKNTPLSATKLKTFLTCKRKYFYKYIEKIESHHIPTDLPKEYEIGNIIHEALKNLYTKKRFYREISELRRDLFLEFDALKIDNELQKYQIGLQKRKMEQFCQNEIDRFSCGWEVESCEESFKREFQGIVLEGRIDRIDKKNAQYFVLDYKSGSYELYNEKNLSNAKDFQLEFYYLLAQNLGEVEGCAYYDLQESKIVNELFLQEKIEILKSIIAELLKIESLNFAKCEELDNCFYCEYNIMCNRMN